MLFGPRASCPPFKHTDLVKPLGVVEYRSPDHSGGTP